MGCSALGYPAYSGEVPTRDLAARRFLTSRPAREDDGSLTVTFGRGAGPPRTDVSANGQFANADPIRNPKLDTRAQARNRSAVRAEALRAMSFSSLRCRQFLPPATRTGSDAATRHPTKFAAAALPNALRDGSPQDSGNAARETRSSGNSPRVATT